MKNSTINTIIKYYGYFLSVFLFLLILGSCEKDVEIVDDTEEEEVLSEEDSLHILVSKWIYDWMDEAYYWNTTIPKVIDFTDKTDPESFFYELVYDEKDKWSYLTDDFTSLEAELSGTPLSMGYSPAFGLISDNQVVIVVEYIYPESPAEIAGLKRGDVILTIDGEYMDTTNYYNLYSQLKYNVGLGSINNGSVVSSGKSISLTAEVIDADPLIYDTIYEISDKKIGYCVYTEFLCGTDDKFLTSIDNVLNEFEDAGVTDLIVDLRYNPGGEGDAATYIASAIAPASVVNGNNVFTKYEYNDLYETYFKFYEGENSENLVTKFSNKTNNLELSSVYFLTTSGTASASELLIIGLEPYMDVQIVGESTYGKYTGMWVIYDHENEPREHDWCIMPVVMKYANAEGYTDFDDGLTPDYQLTDYLVNAKQFGDLDDEFLSTAIQSITGTSLKSSRIYKSKNSINIEKLYNKRDYKRNLIIPHNGSSRF
jgi:C-terminal processing protease CtpA/Prc